MQGRPMKRTADIPKRGGQRGKKPKLHTCTCRFCGRPFRSAQDRNTVCSNSRCQRAAAAEANKKSKEAHARLSEIAKEAVKKKRVKVLEPSQMMHLRGERFARAVNAYLAAKCGVIGV